MKYQFTIQAPSNGPTTKIFSIIISVAISDELPSKCQSLKEVTNQGMLL